MDRLMKVEAVAEQLGIQTTTVWKWLRERRLASTKIGRSRRIPASEVERLIQAGLTVAETGDARAGGDR